MAYNVTAGSFEPTVPAMHGISVPATGEWIPSENMLTPQTLEVNLGKELKPYLTEEVSLILSVAIEFEKVGFTGQPQEVKYAGCGKVIKVS